MSAQTDEKKEVFKKIQEIRNDLKKEIELLKGSEKKRTILTCFQKEKKTKSSKPDELASHYSGLRHELQLVADLCPLYKISKEEYNNESSKDDDVERKRKEEDLKKWKELLDWVSNLSKQVGQVLTPPGQNADSSVPGAVKPDDGKSQADEAKNKTDEAKQKADGSVPGAVKPDDGKSQADEAKNKKDEAKAKNKTDEVKTKLLEISKVVALMKEQIQLCYRQKPVKLASEKVFPSVGKIEQSLLEDYKVFTDFLNRYKKLDTNIKLCFLCMAFFPEDVVIKKRLLVYWWVGEGLLDLTGEGKTTEDVATEVIDKLVDEGLIQIVDKMSGLEIDSYRIHPLVRSALVACAKQVNFFDFEDNGMPTAKLNSRSCKACLVDDADIRQDRRPDYLLTYLVEGEEEPEDEKKTQVDEKLRRLQAFLNRNRQLVDLKSNLFSKMKNLNVLHLGRWQNASKHHIEVETTDFLEGLKYMKHLKYISFQGVSQIRELPVLICKLPFLQVLDLRACHSLQELPEDIGDLNLLTHLDISECYLLDGLPKSLAKLVQLQVLKGFVIGEMEHQNNKKHPFKKKKNKKQYCTLQDLKDFKNLRKLTIHTSDDKFPRKEELEAFKNFVKLQKLSIAWGRGTLSAKPDEGQNTNSTRTNQGCFWRRGADKKQKGTDTSQPQTSGNQEGSKRGSDEMQKADNPTQPSMTRTNPERSKRGADEMQKDTNTTQPSTSGNQKDDKTIQSPTSASKEGSQRSSDKNSGNKSDKEKPEPAIPDVVKFPKDLEKLDLQCFPNAKGPDWLIPGNLKSVKKLYIRGGEMKTLEEMQGQKWTEVKILLLKFLSGFMLKWDQLIEAFPGLIYLEKVNCPRLTFYPCDEQGVWKQDSSFKHGAGDGSRS